MRITLRVSLFIACLVVAPRLAQAAPTLHFSGYDWNVKEGFWGPGPNNWDARNAFVDEQGRLHLKLTQHDGKWYGAEIVLQQRLGFGRYQWQVAGQLDQLDANVVLGLFNYTVPEAGPDGTNEIDIEFARWGKAANPFGNFSVWPAQKGAVAGSHRFNDPQHDNLTTHEFNWSADRVSFASSIGAASFVFAPPDPQRSIPQQPLPVHLNLWLFRGQPPANGQEVEIIIPAFHFTPG